MNADSQVDSVVVSNQGSGYTYGNIDLVAGGVPTGSTRPVFDVIIPPQGGTMEQIFLENLELRMFSCTLDLKMIFKTQTLLLVTR